MGRLLPRERFSSTHRPHPYPLPLLPEGETSGHREMMVVPDCQVPSSHVGPPAHSGLLISPASPKPCRALGGPTQHCPPPFSCHTHHLSEGKKMGVLPRSPFASDFWVGPEGTSWLHTLGGRGRIARASQFAVWATATGWLGRLQVVSCFWLLGT